MKSAALSCADSVSIGWMFCFFLFFFRLGCIYLPRRSACRLFTASSLCPPPLQRLFCLSACLQLAIRPTDCLSVCLSVFVCLLLFLFVSGPVGRLVTGVAPVKPSAGIKRRRVRQALSHYAGRRGEAPFLPLLLLSSSSSSLPAFD